MTGFVEVFHNIHIIHISRKCPILLGLQRVDAFVFFFCYAIIHLQYFEMGLIMCDLTLYRDSDIGDTTISNLFIDEYMAEANDAQIKVYLYLLRMINASKPTNISDMADKFNHTEKDICRALKFWEKKGLLSLDYDQNGGIVGIRLYDPSTPVRNKLPNRISTGVIESLPKVKPQYPIKDVNELKNREDTHQLVFLGENYFKKTLTANDIRSIIFYLDELHFSVDLIDYLMQYCADRGKTSFAYMDKVAIDWSDNNITTIKQAKNYVSGYSTKPVSSTKKTQTAFHRLEKNDYDFNSLEAMLLSQQ